MPPLQYGRLQLSSRFLLSPLAGFTNPPFRSIVRELGGVGLTTTDLVNARGLLSGSEKTWQLTEALPGDRPFAVQIFGAEPAVMADAAQLLESRGVDAIDINMGCPVSRITGSGAGAKMMCQAEPTVDLVRRVVEAVQIPVSVKMRLGWDNDQITAPQFARNFEQVGVAAIAIHGRTREQGFSGEVDLSGIRRVVQAVARIPVIGNGDVRSIPDAARMFHETGCAGVSIGRGALANPWIFRQLCAWEKTGEYGPAGTFDDRLSLLRRQFDYLQRRHGDERAIMIFRKMGHWYLKGMRVSARLRHQFQLARVRPEFELALQRISEVGPIPGARRDDLPEMKIPVPAGPVERW
ncbi:MAG: tRNA dihydrouridine synthase DusB [Planctomycetaceae bacterium]